MTTFVKMRTGFSMLRRTLYDNDESGWKRTTAMLSLAVLFVIHATPFWSVATPPTTTKVGDETMLRGIPLVLLKTFTTFPVSSRRTTPPFLPQLLIHFAFPLPMLTI